MLITDDPYLNARDVEDTLKVNISFSGQLKKALVVFVLPSWDSR